MPRFTSTAGGAWACGVCLAWATAASAFNANGRWSSTATDGPTAPIGNPVTLTWSIVPDGTTISSLAKPSNLISVFDGIFGGGPGGSDLTQRPWFTRLQQSFDRWSALSGLTFIYHGADDGLTSHAHGQWAGQLNMRGDVRLGGASIDGVGGTLAQTGFIPDGDITVDTSDLAYFGEPGTNNDYINLRNTLGHEVGHSLGLGHVWADSANFLMETFNSTSFDGPQMDDVLGVQQLYGDVFEKTNNGNGNNALANAVDLGTIANDQTLTRGVDGGTGTPVAATDTDFVSIATHNDLDFYSFTIATPGIADFQLKPIGTSFTERFVPVGSNTTYVPSQNSNLELQIFGPDPSGPVLLASSNSAPAGQIESIQDLALSLPGQYFLRVAGASDTVQMYQFTISVAASQITGDYNHNGFVDAADYTVWRDTYGHAGVGLAADGSSNGTIDDADFDLWKQHFGEPGGGNGSISEAAPEPGGIALMFTALAWQILRPSSRNCARRRV